MSRLILLLLAVVAIEALPEDAYSYSAWNAFKAQHGRFYQTFEEESKRYNIFTQNLRLIDEHNKEFDAGRKSYQLGANQFADLTNEEFRARMNGYKRPPTANKITKMVFTASNDPLPDSVDWRTKGYVTEVKDQKQCGSCWAFSATGSLEGQHFKKNLSLTSLSEQNLVDCSQKYGNEGCNGGWMDSAFDYIKDNKGIDTEQSYPYEAKDGKCRFNAANVGATDAGFVDIKVGSESDLEAAIATIGPISVAIDASKISFQLYKSGVYDEAKCGNTEYDLDHGVLAVGYGTDSSGKKYYIVKNSWNQSWGDKGYILMSREKNNQCGIATAASYPTV